MADERIVEMIAESNAALAATLAISVYGTPKVDGRSNHNRMAG